MKLSRLFLATVGAALFACSGGSPRAGDGDQGDIDPADRLACSVCNQTMHDCIAEGDDLSGINECIQAFSACVVEDTGRSLVCHNENLCGECLDDCEKEQGEVRKSCLLARSSCIAGRLDDVLLDLSCPDSEPPTCDDCAAALGECTTTAAQASDMEACNNRFAACYVHVTDQPLVCADESAPCSECLDDCGPEEDAARLDCLIARSECILATLEGSGVSEQVIRAANHGTCTLQPR
jgi:hypothetical protein